MSKNIKRSEIAQRLVNLRNNHKEFKTQKDVARALGIKRDTYARYETNTDPQIPIIKKICKLYQISSDSLIFGENNVSYNLNENPITYRPTFNTEIGYNTNINSENIALTKDELELIKHYRELTDSKKEYLKKNIVDIRKI